MPRSITSTCTCRTPDAAEAVPVTWNSSSVGSTRPSMGAVIVVSTPLLAGIELKSKKAIRPTLYSPWVVASPPVNRPRGVSSMCLLPSKEFEPGFHSSAVPSTGLSAPR